MKSQIFQGKVFHKRFSPKIHQFTYESYFLKISLNETPSLNNLFFSINKFNLFSFYDKDHGPRDGSSLKKFAQKILSDNNRECEFDDIIIHTMPRVLGFVFNPVSFWYLYKSGSIEFIIAEVNNTFGENHSYLLSPKDLVRDKKMQVSPFNQIVGNYNFDFHLAPERNDVCIKYFVNSQEMVMANVNGTPSPWTSRNFLKLFLKNPAVNFAIVFFIHWQALRLFLKGLQFYGKNGAIT